MPAIQSYALGAVDPSSPAVGAIAVVPHNTTEQTHWIRKIYVGGTGNITLTPAIGGADVVFTAVPVGATIECGMCKLVKATGTTATLMIGLI